jgi:hypothetical protein
VDKTFTPCRRCGCNPTGDVPLRKFEVAILISGHEWSDVRGQLEEIFPHVSGHGPECASMSAGGSGSHMVIVMTRPEESRERYDQEVRDWFAQHRKEPIGE